MTGDQINTKLERGFLGTFTIKELKASPGFSGMQTPSDLDFQHGVADSVSEQFHRIDAAWDAVNKRLTLSLNAAGQGYWIPYVGNGAAVLKGVAHTAMRGLGAYTPVIPGGISWVATGPFSGCSAADFSVVGGGKVFAHVITPAGGYTADTVNNQVANIAAQVNAPVPGASHVVKVSGGAGEGFVFWTIVGGAWYRRVVWAFNGTVNAVDTKTQL